ncbi:hypothetical protein LEMLEM_LOCUS23305 [Lemmus lemmus]
MLDTHLCARPGSVPRAVRLGTLHSCYAGGAGWRWQAWGPARETECGRLPAIAPSSFQPRLPACATRRGTGERPSGDWYQQVLASPSGPLPGLEKSAEENLRSPTYKGPIQLRQCFKTKAKHLCGEEAPIVSTR